jgi:hypothetical protein
MNILINGDSWGVGEWGLGQVEIENIVNDPNIPGLSHRGIEHYFREKGYSVKNISKGGSHNIASCQRFEQEDLAQYDYIFCFQTDHIRHLNREFLTADGKEKATWEKLKEHQRRHSDEFYQRLNSYNKTIHLLGGVNKIQLDIVEKYPNIVPIMPSVTEFITPHLGGHNDLWWGQWILSIPYIEYDLDCLEKIVQNKESNEFTMHPDFKKYYWPDGKHPNRLGHRIIFDYLCDQLKI